MKQLLAATIFALSLNCHALVIAIEDGAFYNIKIEKYLSALSDLENYLKSKPGMENVSIISINDTSYLKTKLETGDIHVAFTTDLTFIQLFTKFKVVPLLLPSFKLAGDKHYRKYHIQLITEKDSGLFTLEALKEKSMGITLNDLSNKTVEFLYYKYLLISKFKENPAKYGTYSNIFNFAKLKRQRDPFSKISSTLVGGKPGQSSFFNGTDFASIKSDDIDEFCAKISISACNNLYVIARSPGFRRGPIFTLEGRFRDSDLKRIKDVFVQMGETKDGKRIFSALKIHSFEDALSNYSSVMDFLVQEYSTLNRVWKTVSKFELRQKKLQR